MWEALHGRLPLLLFGEVSKMSRDHYSIGASLILAERSESIGRSNGKGDGCQQKCHFPKWGGGETYPPGGKGLGEGIEVGEEAGGLGYMPTDRGR